MSLLPQCLLVALAAVGTALPAAVLAEEIRAAVASNFAPVMEQLAPLFERQTGHKLTVIGGASGQHYAQIINGAPFDVFLSADDERPTLLSHEGAAVAGSVFTYAIGRLVLWSGDPDLVDADGSVLRTGSFRHLALANPRLAPYGQAAQEVLGQWGLFDALQDRIVMGENITQTLQFVHSGSAELGFIARSQWLGLADAGSAWEVPAEMHAPIVQQGILVRETIAGRELMTFLQQDAARTIIEGAGYSVP